MSARPRKPTQVGVARLLRAADFERSESRPTRIRGWRQDTPGYRVRPGVEDGTVLVTHITMGVSVDDRDREWMLRQLGEYRKAIEAGGWTVAADPIYLDGKRPSLVVTAARPDHNPEEG
jgi:hypothetical protein